MVIAANRPNAEEEVERRQAAGLAGHMRRQLVTQQMRHLQRIDKIVIGKQQQNDR